MGFIDKLKNIFFEEEEDEEIEDTRPIKVEKNENVEKEVKEKKETTEVIAKKVEIPQAEKEIKVEKKVIEKTPVKEKETRVNKINTELIFDDDDFIFDSKPRVEKKAESVVKNKNIVLSRVQDKKEEKKELKRLNL